MKRTKCDLSEADVRRYLGDEKIDGAINEPTSGVYKSKSSEAWCIVKNVSCNGKTVATRHGTFLDKTVAQVACNWLHQQAKSVQMEPGAARKWIVSQCGNKDSNTFENIEPSDNPRNVESYLQAAHHVLKTACDENEEKNTDNMRIKMLIYECIKKLRVLEKTHS